MAIITTKDLKSFSRSNVLPLGFWGEWKNALIKYLYSDNILELPPAILDFDSTNWLHSKYMLKRVDLSFKQLLGRG